jgi:hypothetical protein
MPHCGRPQDPPAPESPPLLETWPLTTLKSFVSFVLWQWGQTGFSSPRMSNSIFRLHFWQEYSYNGIGFDSFSRGNQSTGTRLTPSTSGCETCHAEGRPAAD